MRRRADIRFADYRGKSPRGVEESKKAKVKIKTEAENVLGYDSTKGKASRDRMIATAVKEHGYSQMEVILSYTTLPSVD